MHKNSIASIHRADEFSSPKGMEWFTHTTGGKEKVYSKEVSTEDGQKLWFLGSRMGYGHNLVPAYLCSAFGNGTGIFTSREALDRFIEEHKESIDIEGSNL